MKRADSYWQEFSEEVCRGRRKKKKSAGRGERELRKILIVIDMQNDFIDGSLGTKEAVAIVPNVAKKIAVPVLQVKS